MLCNRILSVGIATGLFTAVAIASDGIGNLSLTATSCNPESGTMVHFAVSGSPGAMYTLRAGDPGGSYVPGIGPVDLDLNGSTVVATGMIPPSGMANLAIDVSYPNLSDVVFQGFAADASSPTGMAVSNPALVEVSGAQAMSFQDGSSHLPSMPAVNGGKPAFGDVDGDGDFDAYVPTVGAANAPSMQTQNLLLLNDGSGNFSNATATNLPSILEASNRAVFVDIDGDFDLDVVTANGKLSNGSPQPTTSHILRNDGSGHFALYADVPGGADYIQDVAAGDVDGDGDIDLVLGRDGNGQGAPERLLLNDGSGAFVEAGSQTSTNGNGNGHGNGNGGGNGRNHGGSSGGSGTSGPGIAPNNDVTIAVQLVDVDGDGDIDLVSANADAGGARVYRNDGHGQFTAVAGAFPAADSAYAADMAIGDLDGDGDVDAILVIRTLVLPLVRETRVFLNDGNGSFSRASGAVTGIPSNDQVFNVALGDLDGDGDLDATVVTTSQTNDWILVNDGSAHFAASQSGLPAPNGTGTPTLFDADGDNALDVLYGASSLAGTAKLMMR